MFQVAEVIDTKTAFKSKQKDREGDPIFDGSIEVRLAGGTSLMNQVNSVFAAPATFNRRIPLIGEQVLLFSAPSTETTVGAHRGWRYYYFCPYNTVDDLTTSQFALMWKREKIASVSGNAAAILADKKQVGYTFPTNPGRTKMLQPFEGDDIWEGRFGQSIRFTRHYNTVNPPGTGIYEKSALTNWKGSAQNDPLMILKVKKPETGSGYDLEDLTKDESSIYMTTSHKLLKFKPGFQKNTDVKSAPQWSSGPQIVVDSDRVIINAKQDKAFLIGKTESVVTGKKVLMQSEKHKVDLDDLMDWLKALSGELYKLTSAQAMFTTSMGPTGVATNMSQVMKIAKTDFQSKFKMP